VRRDGVHPVGGRADQDAILAWHAEGAEEGVDGFIGADADEEVGRGEGLGGVGVGVAEVAEELLEVVLVGVWVAVQAEEV
jgi:hypothetical protein